jgi:hypothetical protein
LPLPGLRQKSSTDTYPTPLFEEHDRGPQLDTCSRRLAAADMLDLLATGRPGDAALDPDTAQSALRSAAKEGALDPAAVEAALTVQSRSPPHGHHRAVPQGCACGTPHRTVSRPWCRRP